MGTSTSLWGFVACSRLYFTFTFLRIYVSTLYFYSVFEYLIFKNNSYPLLSAVYNKFCVKLEHFMRNSCLIFVLYILYLWFILHPIVTLTKFLIH